MRVLQVAPCANPELARALLKIQRAAYALEATLIDDDRIPALHEDVEYLRSGPLLWLAASIDGRLVGARLERERRRARQGPLNRGAGHAPAWRGMCNSFEKS